jgi:hypothetical protein
MNSALTAAGAVAGDLASVLSRMRTESGHSSGTFADLTIGSHFQPTAARSGSRR